MLVMMKNDDEDDFVKTIVGGVTMAVQYHVLLTFVIKLFLLLIG